MRRAGWALVVTSLVWGVLSLPARAAVSQPAAVTNTWHVAAQLALGAEETAVDCPDATTCWAIEAGQLLRSTDGGASWTNRTALVPSGIAVLNDVACPTAARCYLTATTSAGTPRLLVIVAGAISALDVPATTAQVTISCPGPLRCSTTDGTTVLTTTDGGQHWAAHSLPSIVYTRPAIDCVTGTTRCWVVGDRGETPLIERTLDGGASWTLQDAPVPTDGLYDVACPTASTCYGAGADFSDHAVIIRTVDAGANWTFASVPYQPYALRSVSCPAELTCTAVGQSPGNAAFVDGTTDGQTWSARTVAQVSTDQPAQLSCPTLTQCVLVAGGSGQFSTDGGITWSTVELPTAIAAPSGLSCATTRQCVGVGNDAAGVAQVITSPDGGTTWTEHALPAGTGRLSDVRCPTRTACFAIAVTSVPGTFRSVSQVLRSSDGGASWVFGRLTDKAGSLGKLTCPSATTCLAGGFDNHSAVKLALTTDGGHVWRPVPAPPTGFYLDGIGCPSATSCVVVTNDPEEAPIAWSTSDSGATYEQHAMPDTDVYDVDCNGTLCVAVGSDGGDGAISTSVDSGVTWAASVFPRRAQIFGAVSCGSSTQCAASAYDFDFDSGGPLVVGTVNSGQRWRAFDVSARHEEPIALACRAAMCVASDVSTTGNPLILAGRA